MKKCLWSIVVLFCLALCACGQNNSANKTSRQAFTALSVAGNENAAIGKVLRDFSDGIFEYMNHPDAEDENYSVLVNECPWVDECCTEKKLIFRLMEEHKSACPVAIDEKHKSDEYEIYYLDEEEAYLRVSNQLFGYMWMVMQKTENQWKISGAAYDFVGDGQYQNENLATMRKFADKFPNAFSFGKNEQQIAEDTFYAFLTDKHKNWEISMPKSKLQQIFFVNAAPESLALLAPVYYGTENTNVVTFCIGISQKADTLNLSDEEKKFVNQINEMFVSDFRIRPWVIIFSEESQQWYVEVN